ncbi:glycosyl hydrolase family 57 [Magnetospira sp. QH-2]|uniref:glycosyl hydrolase family 57 n=1 Tax=Magnetospira sp. (strain QH-2) TaxID=1288970 RepID=UPI0003E80A87|nr:glycosyl hydrolase family 57 [Magnetospira sp. QH-2]CCQ73235.1 putative GH57 : distantly related to a-amylase [Magnetospira sp. QH-2]
MRPLPSFSSILGINTPGSLPCDATGKNPAFAITFTADGPIPFPQVILHANNGQHLINGPAVHKKRKTKAGQPYEAQIPAGLLQAGRLRIQVEGCTQADITQADGSDWIKAFAEMDLHAAPRPKVRIQAGADQPVLYFGIHKHMHQPYYNTTDPQYWDGEKDGIFGSRGGNYTDFVPAAVRQYEAGGLPHAGLSTSWSGTLIEQLDRCARDGLCGGRFGGWNDSLRAMAGSKTALGHPRLAFSGFGFFHPLMPLIPHRNIVRQIRDHREVIRRAFGTAATNILFPPETAFHVRMIPALLEAGIEAVIYDSIHRFRACQDYPYAGIQEGMLPPNPAEQVNPPVDDWTQLQNIWAGSKISPSLLRPEYVKYEDPDGGEYKIIAVPAERYIGNEDARGGFGALQYGSVLGQVHDRLLETGGYDPKHPPFFLLHSDGDNHGGGADSYYHHNTGALVQWLHEEPRFELTGVEDYLDRFPPDPANAFHIEPGSWAGADNGDPQFIKWFSRYDQPYSPDLNSWAVLTALQNAVHSIEDAMPDHPALAEARRLMLTAETSCYWYWTGQDVWDQQVTNAANKGMGILASALTTLDDRSGPTIFPAWVTPENPGGQTWGQGCLRDADKQGTLHSFIHDISGLKRATLVLRTGGTEQRLDMTDHGPYPCRTGAHVSAHYLTCALPRELGDIRYFIEAQDARGNVSRSSLERIFLG